MTFPCFHPDATSLVKKHLTPDRYLALKDLATASGFTLDQAIQSGLALPDSRVGIYAGDSQSYTLFSRIFLPIIQDYHGQEAIRGGHIDDMTPLYFAPLDPEEKFIRSVRIRVARNLDRFSFSCHMTASERLEVERLVMEAITALPDDLLGDYIRFSDLSPHEFQRFLDRNLAFPKGDRFQEAAGMNRDFPAGRGVFLSADKTFRIWVNEEDHLRVMALEKGSDLSRVFKRLAQGLDLLKHHLCFSTDTVLGHLNACPTNLGTAMRAGVHICLPKLARQDHLLTTLVHRHHLQIRGTRGEKTAVENAVFDISNARRLGVSANGIVKGLHKGLAAIIQAEMNL